MSCNCKACTILRRRYSDISKISQSVTERNDEPGVTPLFFSKTGKVVGIQEHGKILHCTQHPLAASSRRPSRLDKERSLTELFGGPL